ncbi:hypothetical protein XA68_10766 [Ophiocordyceps unilateralis]|uniref:Protein kinase domain-containing protein n=1 Tax=Ophiocordyceps unilateralis TaxID=268505 RepID=A0A2A9PHR0_OPHUN|nr:hypothetical protein XA68_10766 [Ophiocordyceps unilateralis]
MDRAQRRRGGRGAQRGPTASNRGGGKAAAAPQEEISAWDNAEAESRPPVEDPASWTGNDEGWSAWAHKNITPDEYKCGQCVGQGGSAIVYKLLRVADGDVFAGKVPRGAGSLDKEAKLLRSFNHGHILKLINWHEEKGDDDDESTRTTLLVTELCAYGTLQARIDTAWSGTTRLDITTAIRQICSAVAYLHSESLFHTDVKPRNVLLRSVKPLEVVLGDCGDALPIGQKGHVLRGTMHFHSPEMWRHRKHHGPSDDVWAMGLTLLAMLEQLPRLFAGEEGQEEKEEKGKEEDGYGMGKGQRRRIAKVQAEEVMKRFTERCSKHATDLKRLNPGDGLVLLSTHLLAWQWGDRVTAAEAELEAALLVADELLDDGLGGLKIKAPDDFRPVAFW